MTALGVERHGPLDVPEDRLGDLLIPARNGETENLTLPRLGRPPRLADGARRRRVHLQLVTHDNHHLLADVKIESDDPGAPHHAVLVHTAEPHLGRDPCATRGHLAKKNHTLTRYERGALVINNTITSDGPAQIGSGRA